MSVATALCTARLAGVPLPRGRLRVRIWIAVVVALYAAFWLQLELASSAAVCVGILAFPTRGQALEKAGYRFLATVIGVVASIAIVGTFSQARDLLLLAFAAWVGLCIYAAGLSDGNRAYAAVLAGYTVAIVAIQQSRHALTGVRLWHAARRRHCRGNRRHRHRERLAGRSRPACGSGQPAGASIGRYATMPSCHARRGKRRHGSGSTPARNCELAVRHRQPRHGVQRRPDQKRSGPQHGRRLVAEVHAARVLAALPGAADRR